MLRRNECRLNFKNRPVKTGDIKGGPKQPPLPLIGLARSLPLIGLRLLSHWRWRMTMSMWSAVLAVRLSLFTLPFRMNPAIAVLAVRLTFALLGGVFEHPPCGFSRIARKRRRAAPPGFRLPYPPSFWQLLWKFRSWVMQGQVTRSGQVTIPYKNFTIAPQLQCLRESYDTFGIW